MPNRICFALLTFVLPLVGCSGSDTAANAATSQGGADVGESTSNGNASLNTGLSAGGSEKSSSSSGGVAATKFTSGGAAVTNSTTNGGATVGERTSKGDPSVGGSSTATRASTARDSSNVGGSPAAAGTDPMATQFAIPTMTIDVPDGAAITSKDTYVTCSVNIDGKGSFADFSGSASIRGRGNSTWLWYDKKPYRIKLDTASEVLGLKQDKDWVLLANYRDPTFLMNAFAFELADWMGLPYTNHSRFVEVTLNGEYLGLYQLTEQIEQGANRVAVADAGGILLCLDHDDGPTLVPDATDNFTSTTYELPVVVKYPKDPGASQLASIRDDFARVEQAITAADYDELTKVLDIPRFIDFLIIQELTYNVELVTPRSMYLHKDPAGVFVMGPVWDFDGGFDFDWTDMETSHDYFGAQDLVMGTDPARSTSVSGFWLNMFKNARFVSEYKARWSALSDSLLPHTWGVMERYATSLSEALDRNASRWPIGKDHATEMGKMKQWLEARVMKLDTTVGAYPTN